MTKAHVKFILASEIAVPYTCRAEFGSLILPRQGTAACKLEGLLRVLELCLQGLHSVLKLVLLSRCRVMDPLNLIAPRALQLIHIRRSQSVDLNLQC